MNQGTSEPPIRKPSSSGSNTETHSDPFGKDFDLALAPESAENDGDTRSWKDTPQASGEWRATAGGTKGIASMELPADAFEFVRREPTFRTLNLWAGRVVAIGEGSFFALLSDLSDNTQDEENAEFPLDDVDPDDIELFREGARFLFMVGYGVDRFGTQTRGSQIRFERVPNWSEDETLDAYEKRKPLTEFFKKGTSETDPH